MFDFVKTEEREFDFNRIIPYPEEFAKLDAELERKEKEGVPYSELRDGYYKGHDWRIEHWGTNRNPTDIFSGFIKPKKIEEVEGFRLSDYENPACGAISFDTAWAPAYPITEALSKQFPELSFKHDFQEFGMLGFGYRIWKAGKLLGKDEHLLWEEDDDQNDDDA
jgi:hypothetical protein